MKQPSAFQITPFTNPFGDIVFRVTGWLDGERVRTNFKTRAEAKAEVQALEIRQIQNEASARTAITRLNDDELHEAETAYRWLKDKPKTLLFYLEFAFANYRAPENDMLLALGIDDYVAAKQRECDQGVITQSGPGPEVSRRE